MKLIVGLGNPGILYSGSRHNIGFQVVKHLAKAGRVALKKEKGIRALSAKARIEGTEAVLALPLTFMNLSGEAVAPLLRKYKAGLDELLVVCDDLDLEFGRLKLQPHGSSAGHRGIKSIIESLGSSEFCRLRIGIGRPRDDLDASGFVLSHFNKSEKARLMAIIDNALDCIRSWTGAGADKTMNVFNRKVNTKGVKA